MKTKIFAVLLVIVLLLPMTALAQKVGVIDEADVLTEAEEKQVFAKLEEVSTKRKIDLVVLTVESLYGMDEMVYADDYYDYNGYGEDGALFLYSVDDGIRYVSTCGECMNYIDDNLSSISEAITPGFDSGDYATAFTAFASEVDDLAGTYAMSGWIVSIVAGVVIGLICAFIVTGRMKSQLKTVNVQYRAENYFNANSLDVTTSKDLFLYRTVTRRAKPKNNSSSHTSSSGRTHGGGRV